jgi:hypothetical protein
MSGRYVGMASRLMCMANVVLGGVAAPPGGTAARVGSAGAQCRTRHLGAGERRHGAAGGAPLEDQP